MRRGGDAKAREDVLEVLGTRFQNVPEASIASRADRYLHPLRGALFESWVASELLKARFNAGRPADLFHLREDSGLELALVAEAGERGYGVEVKSGATVAPDFFRNPALFAERVGKELPHIQPIPRLVYGGDRREMRRGVEVIPWSDVQNVEW